MIRAAKTQDRQEGGKRERNKAANRNAILEAARRSFLEQGYDAVTIRDVIRQTGLAAGTFYNYFRTKEELLEALVGAKIKALTERLQQVRRHARTPQEFVYGAYLAAFIGIADDPVLYNLMMRNEPVVRIFYAETVMGVSVRSLKEDLRDGIRRGLFPKLDVDYLAACFFGAGYEMGRLIAAHDKRHDPASAADFATRLFLGGVSAFSAPRPQVKPRVRATVE